MRSAPITLTLACLALTTLAGCGSDDTSGAGGGAAAPPAVGTVETVSELPGTSEGLAMGVDAAGAPALYVGTAQTIQRVGTDGTTAEVAAVPSPLGMALTADGALLVCGKAEGEAGKGDMPGVLWRVTPDGQADMLIGPGQFELTNYIAIAPDGSLVFSDSKGNKLYRAGADGSGVALVTDAISYPNGLAFSADQSTLYVASWDGKKVHALPWSAADGYGAPEVLLDGVNNVDGIVTLAGGDLVLVQSFDGVNRLAAGGAPASLIPESDIKLPANGALGKGAYGEEWLYVTSLLSRSLVRVYVGDPGAPLPP